MDTVFYIANISSFHPDSIIKIIIALILGGIIGLERETKYKPVGFKTCVIISVTSCILTIVSIQSAEYYAEISANIRTDPMRLAAQIISGVGFLGAGVILHRNSDREEISGLTTAAIIWACAGIGIACGSKFYLYAIFATLLFLITIQISPKISMFFQNNLLNKVKIRLILNEKKALETVLQLIRDHKILIETFNIRDKKNGKIECYLKVNLQKRATIYQIYSLLKQIEYVESVILEQ